MRAPTLPAPSLFPRQQQSQVKRRVPEPRKGREPPDWEGGGGPPLSPGPWLRSFPEAPRPPPGSWPCPRASWTSCTRTETHSGTPPSPCLGTTPPPRPTPAWTWRSCGPGPGAGPTQGAGPRAGSRAGLRLPGGFRPGATPPPSGSPAQEQVPERPAAGQLRLLGHGLPRVPRDAQNPRASGAPVQPRLRRREGPAQRQPLRRLEDLQRDVHKGAPASSSPQSAAAKLQLRLTAVSDGRHGDNKTTERIITARKSCHVAS